MGSPTRFTGLWVRQFVVLPLLHVVSASIPFFVSLVVMDFFFFFFSEGRRVVVDFFQRKKKKRLSFLVFFCGT